MTAARTFEFTPLVDARPVDVAWPTMSWPPPPDAWLTGRYVELRPFVPERDAEPLYRMLDHDQVWTHVNGRPAGREDYAAKLLTKIAAGAHPWVVRLRRSYASLVEGDVLGTSSFMDVSVRDARLEIGSTLYTPSVWGTAVNPDTKLTLMAYAFDELTVGRVQLKTDGRNTRSQRAIARLGAAYEGTLRRHQRRADGTVRDTAMFSVVAEEWPDVRSRLQERLAAVAS
ncbi:MAG: GNAT family N-acetyltransferase [Jiangellaceae bacterium]